MNRGTGVPPRLAEWIVGRVLPDEMTEPYLGDLEQRFHEIASARGSSAARRWYWRQALGAPLLRSRALPSLQTSNRESTMNFLVTDFANAVRLLRRDKGFTALASITLALGIGAATAMFSIVDGVLLRPLPYASSDALVALTDIQDNGAETPTSFPELTEWREGTGTALTEIGAWFNSGGTLTGVGDAESLMGIRMTANLPSMFGVVPIRGRTFRDDEEAPGANRVIMLSERLWRGRFSADSAIIGRVIAINGRDFTVVGVYPVSAQSRMPTELARTRTADFWAPLRLDETTAPRGLHFIDVVGRLKPGVSLETANTQMSAHAKRDRGDTVRRHDVELASLDEVVIGDSDSMLKLLLGAVTMLLLIACANVANLLLARAAFRYREFAVRLALGASRARIVSQLLAENIVRSLLGGMLGVVVAYGALWGVRRFMSLRLPRFDEVAIDARVLAVAFLTSVLTGILFGLIPALSTARHSSGALRGGGRGISGGLRSEHVRRGLIVAEIAMSFVLLAGAGLLMKSFVGLAQAKVGFDEARLVSSFVTVPASRYRDSNMVRAFYREAQRELGAIPGVEGVAFTSDLPVQGGTNGGVNIEGRTFDDATRPIAEKRVVSANYLQVIGAKLKAGRMFEDYDIAGSALPAVIINETFAKRWFPGESAIGKRVDFLWEVTGLQTIVGVVEDVREGSQAAGPLAAIYIPVEQRSISGMNLIVRAKADPKGLTGAIRTRMSTIDPLMPVPTPTPLADVVAGGISRQRATTLILGTFAAIALLLAAIGLYGVISYSVTQRTRELGVRAALGAQASDLMQLVLRQGALFLAAGVVIGVAGALALTRYISAELYGVTPLDGQTYVLVALVLGVAALAAIAVPARRATRSDPLSVLRSE